MQEMGAAMIRGLETAAWKSSFVHFHVIPFMASVV